MKHANITNPCLSASVSCMDLLNLEEQLREVEEANIAFLHYDVVDGQFNQCYILGDTLLEKMSEKTSLPIEAHLAIYEPEKHIERFAKAGASYITVQYEALIHPLETFALIRSYGCEPALCYKSTTPPGDDFLELAKEAAWILKLTVNPGFSGQKIQPQAIEHIRTMASMLKEAGIDTPIQADGNVNRSTISLLHEAGATIFTGGTSGLFLENATVSENATLLLQSI